MIVAGSASPLLLSSAGGYNLTNSLRFRSSASAYLNRTPASAGNRRTYTWSGWVKRGILSSGERTLFNAGGTLSDTGFLGIRFTSDDKLDVTTGSTDLRQTTQVFRDPSAWYHIVVAMDTTQATGSNRVKVYLNGTQITAFSTSNDPSLNLDTAINNTVGHAIGLTSWNSAGLFDGYMTEINFIDGQALTPSSFGQTSPTTGVWIPKKYTGTYGTNGFYLPFTNTSSTSTLGNDFSGNNNTWTVNNISLTSGATYDSMKDVPTLTDADTANYCVINPISNNIAYSITNGNLSISNGSTQRGTKPATFFITSGKWYWEAAGNGYVGAVCGINGTAFAQSISATGSNAIGYWEGGIVYWDGGNSGAGPVSYTTSDIIGIALNMDSGTVAFYKNNSLQYTATFGSGTVPNLSSGCFPCYSDGFSTNAKSADFNFGQRPFTYTPPSGFKALNTYNLPTPTIGATASTTANKYFDVLLYTGNGTLTTRTGLSLATAAGLVWIKSRSAATDNIIEDSNVGTGSLRYTNSTAADGSTGGGWIQNLSTTGFSTDVNGPINTNGATYVSWVWAGASNVTNTAGSITSTVSANTTAGFSIVTFTAPSTSQSFTVGHGLGVAPSMVIKKRRDASLGGSWWTWHIGLGDNTTDYLALNTTDAEASLTNMWGTVGRTSTLLGFNVTASCVNSETSVVYCFAQVAGYSAFGSYTGNGSSDGPFIYTGFRPRFVLVRRTDSGPVNWFIWDTSRDTYNVAFRELYPDQPNAESTSTNSLDILSNGIKIRTSSSDRNASGGTYIYACFAESPFKYANAR